MSQTTMPPILSHKTTPPGRHSPPRACCVKPVVRKAYRPRPDPKSSFLIRMVTSCATCEMPDAPNAIQLGPVTTPISMPFVMTDVNMALSVALLAPHLRS